MTTALKRGLSCCVDTCATAKRVNNVIEQLVILAFGADVRSQCSLPKAEWAADVFNFSVYGSSHNAFEVNWPHFCLAQVNNVYDMYGYVDCDA